MCVEENVVEEQVVLVKFRENNIVFLTSRWEVKPIVSENGGIYKIKLIPSVWRWIPVNMFQDRNFETGQIFKNGEN